MDVFFFSVSPEPLDIIRKLCKQIFQLFWVWSWRRLKNSDTKMIRLLSLIEGLKVFSDRIFHLPLCYDSPIIKLYTYEKAFTASMQNHLLAFHAQSKIFTASIRWLDSSISNAFNAIFWAFFFSYVFFLKSIFVVVVIKLIALRCNLNAVRNFASCRHLRETL